MSNGKSSLVTGVGVDSIGSRVAVGGTAVGVAEGGTGVEVSVGEGVGVLVGGGEVGV